MRFFFVLEEELRPPFCFYQHRFRAGNNAEPATLPRSTVAVGSFCFAEAAGLQPVTPVSEPGQQKQQVRPGRLI